MEGQIDLTCEGSVVNEYLTSHAQHQAVLKALWATVRDKPSAAKAHLQKNMRSCVRRELMRLTGGASFKESFDRRAP